MNFDQIISTYCLTLSRLEVKRKYVKQINHLLRRTSTQTIFGF